MSDHRSHPDQLMARALGVCWHSPTSDRWPCQEPCSTCGGSGTIRMANNRPYLSWAYREWVVPCSDCSADADSATTVVREIPR